MLAHGSGGTQTRDLIHNVFAKHFSNAALDVMGDSALIEIDRARLAFTTDSYIVKPIEFPGGGIGRLAVCGTINDLAVAGAKPLYISAGFIIEEGFEIPLLERIVARMASIAKEAGVAIVTGDTKVVEKGGADGIFINTAGVGEVISANPILASRIKPGDAIIINGPIADHGMAIMAAREGLNLKSTIESDCAPLNELVEKLVSAIPDTRFMRDATRGGLGAVLCEAAEGQNFGIEIDERRIPLNEGTLAACEILGIDPIYVANEGKLVAFVPEKSAETALATIRSHTFGKEASIIGHVTEENTGKVTMKTSVGSRRLIVMPSGDQLPRIC